jgi:hypothetical protein
MLELLVALGLVGVMFLAAASLYASAGKFMARVEDKGAQMDRLIAMQHIARRVSLGSEAQFIGTNQLKVRWDYDVNGTPLFTPWDSTDDTWVKYGLVLAGPDLRLRWKIDSSSAGIVTPGDPEVQTGLTLLSANSGFWPNNPTSFGNAVVVRIVLEAQCCNPPEISTVQSDVLLHADSK